MLGSSTGQTIKSAAELVPQISTEANQPQQTSPTQDCTAVRPWYEQERHAQHDEPTGGASTSGSPRAAEQRQHVKFAGSSSDTADLCPAALLLPQHPQNEEAGSSTPITPGGRAGFFSFTRPKHTLDGALSRGQQPGDASLNASGPSFSAKHMFGAFSRAHSHTAQGQHSVGFDVSVSGSSSHHLKSHAVAATAEAGSHSHSEAVSRTQSVAASGMSATLKGLLGGASSKIFGSIMGRNSSSSKSDDAAPQQEELWFTGLDDFKPICHMLHRGRYMSAYFACANKTGQHFLLKKYDKHKMLPAEELGVRRAVAFSELLQHPNLVRMMGTWESDDTIFVVEEYVGKGDILNDCISHPDKYTEHHVAVALAKPLLQALAHLHANNIIHRSVLPENAYMGLDDVLRLGHLVLAIDQTSDRPKSMTTLLDYMAPEMLSIRPHNEHELALLDDDSEDGGDSSSSSMSDSRREQEDHQQQHQQQWQSLTYDHLEQSQLGLLYQDEAVSPTAAAVKLDKHAAAMQQPSANMGLQAEQQQHSTQAAGRHHQLQQHEEPEEQQVEHANKVQQPPQLEPSRQASLDLAAKVQLDDATEESSPAATAAVAAAAQAAALANQLHSKPVRSGSRAFLGPCVAGGRAEWEYQDHYTEKVDIWQLGCMLHELLCGSMPFELDSKLESAGLSLWADIEVLPGSVPPDCADFLQQALTKNPRQRPTAQQLLQHPWLARCQAGDPWRDPLELEAARREAELATITGWIRYHWAAAATAVSNVLQHWQRGSRVAPLQATTSHQQNEGGPEVACSKVHSTMGHASQAGAACSAGVGQQLGSPGSPVARSRQQVW